jgi:hypothetical protein
MMDGFTVKHVVFSESAKHESPYAAVGDRWLSINEKFRTVAIGYTVYQILSLCFIYLKNV